jgi:L-seryl-tRNA(Ser) seleniumtransferase
LVEAARAAIDAGDPDGAVERARAIEQALITRVINGTGVLLHTNLGRAPLGVHREEGYSNLEVDLATGHRGSRQARVATLVAAACRAEAALVVNNGAAAVLLALAALAHGRPVAVSRGELVEIGGGFRVPDVMAQSGAVLVEVGTTNRTRRADYEAAAAREPLAAVLKVHRSNYRIVGFTEEVPVSELAALGPPVIADLGSGLLDIRTPWLGGPPPAWLQGEPAVRQTLEDGAALVTFSGDKLLGGPQAGILAGGAQLVERCARHPLARALRPGGLVLEALQEVLLSYLRRDGQAIPFWRLASLPTEELRRRAEKVAAEAGDPWRVAECSSVPGGGSLPGLTIPSVGVAAPGDHTGTLRAGAVPVIARVHDGRTVVDLRAVAPADDALLVTALTSTSS